MPEIKRDESPRRGLLTWLAVLRSCMGYDLYQGMALQVQVSKQRCVLAVRQESSVYPQRDCK